MFASLRAAALFLIGVSQPLTAQVTAGDRVAAAVDSNTIRAHLEFLADDLLEGRETGTRGGWIASRYIEAQFERLGLEPAGDGGSYRHRVSAPGYNVIARLPGREPRADEAVVVSAHYDHLGIGMPVGGDSIYNGALDNAAGTAAMLAVAEAFVASGVTPERSILFIAFDAEELGLRGSRGFIARPTVPLDNIIAMLNFEAANLFGRTDDAAAVGLDRSPLAPAFKAAAQAEGLRVPDSLPPAYEAFYRRSDQLAFAEAGIPAILMWIGSDFVARPAGYADSLFNSYMARRYHQPSDEVLPAHSTGGAAQQVRVAARLALALANAAERPRPEQASTPR